MWAPRQLLKSFSKCSLFVKKKKCRTILHVPSEEGKAEDEGVDEKEKPRTRAMCVEQF